MAVEPDSSPVLSEGKACKGKRKLRVLKAFIYSTADLGKPKIDSGREAINALNPDVEDKIYDEQVTASIQIWIHGLPK